MDASSNESRQASPAVVYALGDSTASGVGARQGSYVDRLLTLLRQQNPQLTLVNLSKSGATTEDVLREQVPRLGKPNGKRARVPAAPPEDREPRTALVLLGVGINDLVRRISPEQFAATYGDILTSIQRRFAAPVVVSNLPDVSLVPAVMRELRPEVAARVRTFNARIQHVAGQHGVAVFDAAAFSQRLIPKHPNYISGDGFHPSDDGYAAWAREMWPLVQNVLMATRPEL